MAMQHLIPIKRALISVSDKTDLVPFATRLASLGVTIISTGGTAKLLSEAGLNVTPIDRVTEFPEMMDGRVKTLHPRVHGGLLALRDHPEHAAAMNKYGIEAIDLVCVNLYPFEQTITRENVTFEEAIEQIDIGGPSMLRSGAKNHAYVTVVTDPSQYDRVVADLDEHEGSTTLQLRRRLAQAAFARTAEYDAAIASWMAGSEKSAMPLHLQVGLRRNTELRYGENPHQAGAVYVDEKSSEASVARATQLHGKELSFNNLYDANGALELVKEIDGSRFAAAAVIKHANPCGFAMANEVSEAFERAYAGDPLAAFGGIVAVNRPVDETTARKMAEGQKFLEVVVAPGYEREALTVLKARWKNVRLLQVKELPTPTQRDPREMDWKRITGGLLVQQRDLASFDPSEWKHAAGPAPTAEDLNQLAMAMIVAKHLKSNAVCLVADRMLVGAGAGQMDRMTSCRLCIEKAGDRARGAYAGSDAFFPFRDGPDLLIGAGVRAIAQPGGSVRDEETITACQEADATLMLTGRRHFRH